MGAPASSSPSLSYGESASQTASQKTSGFQEAGSYFNFGAGTLAAPQENNIGGDGAAFAPSAGKNNAVLYTVAAVAVAALLITIAANVRLKT